MGTRGPPRGECVLPQLLPLCNKPRFEVLDQFSICCFIVHFARLIEEASGFLRRLDLNLRSFFILDKVGLAVNISVLMYFKKSVTHPGNNLVRIFCGEGKVCKWLLKSIAHFFQP